MNIETITLDPAVNMLGEIFFNMNPIVRMTIEGEPASKANSRQIVTLKSGKRKSIKSEKARNYVEAFTIQCAQKVRGLLPYEGDVAVFIKIYYASRRPDLDESIILDAMQGMVYKNDRQVKGKTIVWGLDRKRPRVDIAVYAIEEFGG